MLCLSLLSCFSLFFFNDTATTEIYTLSLHDALPIFASRRACAMRASCSIGFRRKARRSEEHTSELQSPKDLVCRLLLEKPNDSQLSISGGARFPGWPVFQQTRQIS